MKVELHNGSMMIIPQTDFERQWMAATYEVGVTYKAFTRRELMRGGIWGMLIKAENPTTQPPGEEGEP